VLSKASLNSKVISAIFSLDCFIDRHKDRTFPALVITPLLLLKVRFVLLCLINRLLWFCWCLTGLLLRVLNECLRNFGEGGGSYIAVVVIVVVVQLTDNLDSQGSMEGKAPHIRYLWL
jgi:hypothetical protein